MTIQIAPDFAIPIDVLRAQRISLLGKSGSGKTYTLQVLARGCIAEGIPFTLINPISLLYPLPGAVVVRWRDPDALTISEATAPALAEMAIKKRLTVLLDMRMCPAAERLPIVQAYVARMWDVLLEQEHPSPYGLFIDEAQIYAPQDGSTPLKATLIDMAMRGRHMDVISIMATQRPAKIDKDILNQSSLYFVHRMSAKTDTGVLIDQLPDMTPREITSMTRKLNTGQAVVIGDKVFLGEDDYRIMQVRSMENTGGEKSDAPALIPARPLDAALIDRLRDTLAAAAKVDGSLPSRSTAIQLVDTADARTMVSMDEFTRLQKQVAELQEKLVGVYRQLSQMTIPAAPARSVTTRGGTQLELVEEAAQHDEVQVERTSTTERITYTSSRSMKHRITVQTEAFDRLLGELRQCSKFYRQLLVMMAENVGKVYHTSELAPRFDRAEPTVYDAVLYLERRGLLKRTAVRTYTSCVDAYIQQHFPDLTLGEMFERLMNQLAA